MIYVYVLVGMLVPILVLVRRELLVQRDSSRLILLVSTVLFVVGLLLHFTEVGREAPSGALLAPLLTFGLFRGLRKLFQAILQTEPVDTYLDWSPNLGWHRAFNIIYFILSGWLLVATMAGMRALAKAGW